MDIASVSVQGNTDVFRRYGLGSYLDAFMSSYRFPSKPEYKQIFRASARDYRNAYSR